MGKQLSLEHVCFSYEKEEETVFDANIVIGEGDCVFLQGENGSGKSTLLRVMLGILKAEKGTRTCTFLRPSFLTQAANDRKASLDMSVREIVSLGLKSKPFSFMRKSDWALVDEMLRSLDIYEIRNKRLDETSGGQQQKARLAKCLIGSPDFLVLDEPTTGIDEPSRKAIRDALIHYNRCHNAAIVMVSHLSEDALPNSISYVMKAGKLEKKEDADPQSN